MMRSLDLSSEGPTSVARCHKDLAHPRILPMLVFYTTPRMWWTTTQGEVILMLEDCPI
jgi:hypothetical protein